VRIANQVLRRLGQPGVIDEIIAGVLLGLIAIAVFSVGVPFVLGFLIGKSSAAYLAPGTDSLT
jgi:Kef-type K+ transport system membrane component KefB